MNSKVFLYSILVTFWIFLISVSDASVPEKIASKPSLENEVIDLDEEHHVTINKTIKEPKIEKIVFDQNSNDVVLSDDDGDDDVELTTGSGSGSDDDANITSAEKFTELVLSVSELGSKEETEEKDNNTSEDSTTERDEDVNYAVTASTTKATPQLPVCREAKAPKWSAWSIWMQTGNADFRFRSCILDDKVHGNKTKCNGPRMEVKPCQTKQIRKCMTPFGAETEEYKQSCRGSDIMDLHFAAELFDETEASKDCRFSLYDAVKQKFVHTRWSMYDLQERGDKVLWCDHREIFLPFSSSHKLCQQQLEKYCKGKLSCKYKSRKNKSRGDFKHKCWKKFLLGYSIPSGFPSVESDMYFLCQKYADRSLPANVFGTKDTYYGTIYNTAERIPLMSFGRFRDLGEESWPVIPYMIEKGLQQKEYSFFNWLSTKKQKGMFHKEIPSQQTAMCEIGEHQAITYDFDSLKFEINQLLPSILMGSDVGKRISAFTLTNTAPMHVSLHSAWKRALINIREFAVSKCGIPIGENQDSKNRHQSHNTPEMYIISGAVPSKDPKETTGNDVNVPFLFWLAGCCVRGAETSSFSIYARNTNDSPIIASPVVQLEVLLSDLYNTTTKSIKLFPALDGVCGDIGNDKSEALYL